MIAACTNHNQNTSNWQSQTAAPVELVAVQTVALILVKRIKHNFEPPLMDLVKTHELHDLLTQTHQHAPRARCGVLLGSSVDLLTADPV